MNLKFSYNSFELNINSISLYEYSIFILWYKLLDEIIMLLYYCDACKLFDT